MMFYVHIFPCRNQSAQDIAAVVNIRKWFLQQMYNKLRLRRISNVFCLFYFPWKAGDFPLGWYFNFFLQ